MLYERLERAGRAIAAAQDVVRQAGGGLWAVAAQGPRLAGRAPGHRSPVDLSVRPRSELETSDALPELEATKAALLGGRGVGGAGADHRQRRQGQPARPSATCSRRRRARTTRSCARRPRGRRPPPTATRMRGTGGSTPSGASPVTPTLEGAWNLHAKGTVAGRVDHLLGARPAGRRDVPCKRAPPGSASAATPTPSTPSPRWLVAPAASATATPSADDVDAEARLGAPQHLALLRLDIEALWRGYVEGDELCEITGLGPIPVATARACWATPCSSWSSPRGSTS